MANSKRRCPHCKEYNKPEEGLLLKGRLYCNLECAVSYGKKNAPKAKVKQEKDDRARLRRRKKQVKRNSDHASEAQDLFNKMRRLEELLYFAKRGEEPWCISCQKPLGGDVWACGHYKTRGARKDLAFDRENTHLQHNFSCNSHKSGDVDGQKIGFVLRYGEEKAKQILSRLEIVGMAPKRTWEDWEEMKREFRKEIRRLEKELEMYQ